MSKKTFTYVVCALLVGMFVTGFLFLDKNPLTKTDVSKTNQTDIQQQEYHISDAPPVYTDDFDGANDTNALKTRGYKVYHRSSAPQTSATWFQGNSGVFPAFNGPPTGYVAANYQVIGVLGNIDSWLVFPRIGGGLLSGDSLYFYSRAPTASTFPDSIRVMYSANDSVPEGSWTELGRFKATTAGTWERRGFRAPTTSVNGRFAIRYCVVNGGPPGANSDYIGIDASVIQRTAAGGPQNYMGTWPTPGVNTNYIAIPHQASMIGFGNNVTIEGWVRVGNTTAPSTVLNKGAGSFDYQLGINTGGLPFFRAQGVVANGTVPVVQGVWTHVAVVSNGTTVTFFINGLPGPPQPVVTTLGASANEMRVGRGNNDPCSGNMDEVRLWSVVRTQNQIETDRCRKYPAGFISNTGLKAIWHLDNNANDSVSGYNGTIMGTVTFDTVSFPIPGVSCTVTGIEPVGNTIPSVYSLAQNYPNPFNPTTNIKFSLPKGGYVTLKVYDLLGKEVATLVQDPYEAGTYVVDFNASALASGVYFYSLESGSFNETKKMLLVK